MPAQGKVAKLCNSSISEPSIRSIHLVCTINIIDMQLKKWMAALCLLAFGRITIAQTSLQPDTRTGAQRASPNLRVKGSIRDSRSGTALPGATVEIICPGDSEAASTQTDESGNFIFPRLHTATATSASTPTTKPTTAATATQTEAYHIRVSNVGYRPYEATLDLSDPYPLHIGLQRIDLFMQPIEVKALRAGDRSPFTRTDLNKSQIEKTNLGQDIPFMLNQTPSVVVNSDAGNGVGYTALYIRGTDDSRINMTLNGLPYNDPEEQSLFFVDIPDLASSTNSIQIQRGVGTSSNGAGAFGATINFSTNEFNDKAYGETNNSYGSFNTWKNTVRVGSGLIDDHFTIDARLSRISSDGYIDRATSDLKSLYFSTAYYSKKSSLRFNIIYGNEKTYQAWNGIPEQKLDGNPAALDQHYQSNLALGSLYFNPQDSMNLFNSNNRTYNYFTYKNQTDNYMQDHYQLFFNHQFTPQLAMNVAGFITRGLGYFEEFHDQADSGNAKYTAYGLSPYIVGNDTLQSTSLVRQRWLDNFYYGGIFSLQYKKGNSQLTLGGGWDRFNNKHYGKVIWTQNGGFPNDYQYYYEPADKTDFSAYAKIQQQLTPRWTLFADLQYRHIDYQIDGFDDNPSILVHPRYDFWNPKTGITYTHGQWQAYLSWSLASHEPSRADFETGADQQPKPEILNDFELSLQKKNSRYSWGATVYYMVYHDQLALTGQINDVGGYTRSNLPQSYRLGLELEGTARPADWLSADANLTLSRNKVMNYTEYDYNYDNGSQPSTSYKKTDISFSPAVVGAATLNFLPFKNAEFSLLGKWVGKEYLDNAQQETRKLDGYYVQNLRAIYTIKAGAPKEIDLIFQLNNAFGKKYTANGYTYNYIYGGQRLTDNFLFPMAGTNFMFAVNIKF
jgi:iron complex outermembrane recepter protein